MALRSVNDCLQLKRGEKRVLDDWRGEVELVGDVGRIDGRQRSIAHRSSSSLRCLYHWIRMWIANVHLLRNVVVENRIAVLLGESISLVSIPHSSSIFSPPIRSIDWGTSGIDSSCLVSLYNSLSCVM